MKKITLLLFGALLQVQAADFAVTLPEKPTAVERTAAAELVTHLGKLSGKSCAVASREARGKIATFHLGETPENARALGIDSFAGLKPDEVRLRRIGNEFYLAGERKRGTLYAVYTLLEDILGVRFFAPDETYYPAVFSLPAELDYRYAPCFIVREISFAPIRLQSDFAARSRINGHWLKTKEAWGGHETILGFCHTFGHLMPPSRYGSEHPEFYSEINGQRRPVGNQLCLSNKEMRQELANNVRALLKKNPATGIVSISQDDNNDYCRCKKCKELAALFGNRQSGPIIDCLNEIAASLEKEFPDVLFETLAYAYSVEAPQNIRPRANVLVRLCSTGDFGRPMSDPVNEKFHNALKSWSHLTDKLMVWHYVSLFANYLEPQPNWGLHAEDLRLFRKHNVIAVFNQSYAGTIGDFAPLRTYLNRRLLWNPDLDETELTDEFLRRFYGEKALPYLKKYFALCKVDYAKNPKFQLKWSSSTSDWLPYEKMETMRRLMNEAVKVSTGRYAERLRDERTAIDLAFLRHAETPSRYADNPGIPAAVLKEFSERTRECRSYGEGLDLNRLKKSLTALYTGRKNASARPLPEALRGIPEASIVVIDSEDLIAYENKIRTERHPGFVRMRADHKAWLVQFPDVAMRARTPGKWKIYMEARTTGDTRAGRAFELGFYDGAAKKTTSKRFDSKQSAGKEFKLFAIDPVTVNHNKQYIFCAPVDNPAVGFIDIGRIFLVKTP